MSFLLHIGAAHAAAVLGLVVGGVAAAPLGGVVRPAHAARAAVVLAPTTVPGLGINNVLKALH